MASSNEPERAKQRLDVPSQSPLERVLQLDGRQEQGPAKPAIRSVQQSELMSKLQQFIPQLASANKKLEEEPEASGMEIQGEAKGPAVELDLACGIFDLKNEASERAAERSLVQTDPLETPAPDDEESSDEEDETVSGLATRRTGAIQELS